MVNGLVASPGNIPIRVALQSSVSRTELEELWRGLEARASGGFFLSWSWIGTLLETSGAAPRVMTLWSGDELVGLGLLNEVDRWRWGMRRRCVALNETGRLDQDCIMIEDNGFLAAAGTEEAVARAALRHLVEAEPHWRELRLGGIARPLLEAAAQTSLPLALEAKRASPFVDLAAVGEDGVLTRLSRNARQQISRAIRLYEACGSLRLDPSADVGEAIARFGEMETLHQQRWQARGSPGAFAEPFFGRFHRALLAKGFPRGHVDVLRVAAGSEIFGYLHVFFYAGDAYVYQNGFRYDPDGRLKPGLVSHVLALRHCRQRGLRRYRFLAGDSRYKRSLSTDSYDLSWVVLRRPDLAWQLERLARHIARRPAVSAI